MKKIIHKSFWRYPSKFIPAVLIVWMFFIPIKSFAVSSDSLRLILADTQLYNDRVLSDITASNIDQNLDQMIQIYINKQGGLIPSHLDLRNLQQFFNQSRINNVRNFNQLAQSLRKEFARYYARYNQGRLSDSEKNNLEALELDTTQWIMDFLIVNTSYDHDGVGQRDSEVESLYRLFFGKQTNGQNRRVHVCSSISEAAVILGVGEFGMRPESLRVHNVFEDYKGNKYPDSNGIGHVVLGFESISLKNYMFDQSSRPLKKVHRIIGSGETLGQITQEQAARVELNKLNAAYKKIYSQKNISNAEEKNKQIENIERKTAQLLENSALDRHGDLEKSVVNLYEVLQSSLHKGKVIAFVTNVFENINQGVKQANSAFREKRWQEAERLYSLLAEYSDSQIELLTPVLIDVTGLQDGNGNPIDGEVIIDTFKDNIHVFEKNIEAAKNNYVVEIQRKEFGEYKIYESRFNSFGKTISSLQVHNVINKLKVLKDEVRSRINSRTLQPRTRNYYTALNDAIAQQIEKLIKFSKRVGAK